MRTIGNPNRLSLVEYQSITRGHLSRMKNLQIQYAHVSPPHAHAMTPSHQSDKTRQQSVYRSYVCLLHPISKLTAALTTSPSDLDSYCGSRQDFLHIIIRGEYFCCLGAFFFYYLLFDVDSMQRRAICERDILLTNFYRRQRHLRTQ